MNDPTPISVVIASHGRPGHLLRCLTALRFQAYPRVEVVVVSDRAGLAALRDHPASGCLKTLRFDEENLSRARNLGVKLASGDIVAFIDDDAVAEPTWLSFLSLPLRSEGAAAAVGAVRGRNGISFQSCTPWIDRTAQSYDSGTSAAPSPTPDGAVPKLVGTNMAVRREVLVALGGFDEALRFFLEDADLSLRLSDKGHRVAFAPDAQVLHAFAESTRRTKDRRPLTLFEIGRSLAIFLRKHAEPGAVAAARACFREDERRRAISHMIRGTLGPDEVAPLLATFEAGIEEGTAAEAAPRVDWGTPPAFLPFPTLRPDGRAAGWPSESRGGASRGRRTCRDAHGVRPDDPLSSRGLRLSRILDTVRGALWSVGPQRTAPSIRDARGTGPGGVGPYSSAQNSIRRHNPVTNPMDKPATFCRGGLWSLTFPERSRSTEGLFLE